MINFRKMTGHYQVEIDGIRRGNVKRVEHWTVRGNRISWDATDRRGVHKGSAPTRAQAAEYLKASNS